LFGLCLSNVHVQNIDLHALTGWIPERVAIRSQDFNAEREFQRIYERFHSGHCMVTVATGELRDGAADRAGLVPTHAYAVLDIRLIQVVLCRLAVALTTLIYFGLF